MPYYWFKAFHIIGVVVWFAGLFYLVRLFIYHVEAEAEPEPASSILKSQYEIMEKRLYRIITTPGMLVTVAMAIGLLVINPDWLKQGWMHAKLGFVVVLLGYHHYCGRLMKQLWRGECKWSSKQLRALNEAPTLLLVVIVMLVIFKKQLAYRCHHLADCWSHALDGRDDSVLCPQAPVRQRARTGGDSI